MDNLSKFQLECIDNNLDEIGIPVLICDVRLTTLDRVNFALDELKNLRVMRQRLLEINMKIERGYYNG
jgi:hypothetical protein